MKKKKIFLQSNKWKKKRKSKENDEEEEENFLIIKYVQEREKTNANHGDGKIFLMIFVQTTTIAMMNNKLKEREKIKGK